MFNILINLFNRKFLHYDAHAFLNFDMAAMAIFVFLNRSFLHRQQLNLGILFRDSRHSQTCARGTLFAWPSQQKSAKKGALLCPGALLSARPQQQLFSIQQKCKDASKLFYHISRFRRTYNYPFVCPQHRCILAPIKEPVCAFALLPDKFNYRSIQI